MFSRHAVKVANKRLGIADEKRLCPAYIFCSKFVTAGRNCTARQSQHGDSYLKSVAGFPRPFDLVTAIEVAEHLYEEDSKQKPFIRWQGQKAVNRREHFLFLCSQISPDLQKQIDDVFIHIVTVHLM